MVITIRLPKSNIYTVRISPETKNKYMDLDPVNNDSNSSYDPV